MVTTDSTALAFNRFGHLAVAAVLVCAFVTGGGSYDRGTGDVVTQLLALPLLAWALLALHGSPGYPLRRAAVAVAVLVAAVPVLQQLLVGEALWRAIDTRGALIDDLGVAGVETVRHAWSLSPVASERGGWSILPALAVFLGALAMSPARHRALLLTVVGLAAGSLLLGYMQLGTPQDSLLNPFPEWAPALNGLFANPNHQATALAIALAAIVAMLLHDRQRQDEAALPGWGHATLALLGVLMLASLPLTGSRAALLLAVLAVVAVARALRQRARGGSAPSSLQRGGQAVLGLLAVGVIAAAAGWLRVDIAEELRWSVARVTAAMGTSHLPTGAGSGSFVAWFEQVAPPALLQVEYFNHAHNEYAQWWFEGGLATLAALVAVTGLLGASLPRSKQARGGQGNRGVAVAAWAGCAVLLLHSVADYPLRTPALMTTGALLAALAVAQHGLLRERRRVPRSAPPGDAAAQ